MGKPVPYYEHAGITIYHGDCREVLPALDLADVDLVLTDPPYPDNPRVIWTDFGEIDSVLPPVRQFVFWDAFAPFPWAKTARHIWHKPNGRSAKQFECIYERNGGAACKVYRIAAILPNYTQFAAECVDHPTQKPRKLIQRLMGDARVPLDPFMGSGTTLDVAKRLGRRAIGIECEERYCEIAAKRLAQDMLPGVA